jgi:methyl-CpG-binding domain protein 4
MIHSLRLSQKHSVELVRMSDDYINKHWKDNPTVLYGIGKYGSDVYRIFYLGVEVSFEPKDRVLSDYHVSTTKYDINYSQNCV